MEMKDEIAQVAYDFYLISGRQEGRDLENWLKAEQLVFTWHESDSEREKHVGNTRPDDHVLRATYDTIIG
jgi:hypothetical protein